METSLLFELIKYAPVPIGCLVVIYMLVKIFLKHLEKRDEVLKEIGHTCHDVQPRSIEAINDNSKVLGQVMECLNRLNGAKL